MKGKAVITGGSGFMGSHIADELSSRGYKVTIIDRKPSSWVREDQEMVVSDMLDSKMLEEVIQGTNYLYHYAGIADIYEAAEHPYDTVYANVMGTTAVLEAAVRAKINRFVYASTMYVYSPFGSFYRASKQAAETIIEAYHEKFGLGYTMLRYGSLYGPRSQDWNGLRRYVKQVVQEGRLDYRGNGNERREYIHARDAARLSVDILHESYKNCAITVTGSQVLNSSELIDMIFEIANCERNVKFIKDEIPREHYTMTPYRYTPKRAKKIAPDEFVDIGQGILDLVEEIYELNEK